MVEHTASRSVLTVEEYLKIEETGTVRHGYVAGVIHAMTGATKRHNRIVGNIYRRLANAAGAGPCRVYLESVKLRASDDVFYYPDVMIACDPDDEPFYETGPCLLVEVTFLSTESIDRREKLAVYKSLLSLKRTRSWSITAGSSSATGATKEESGDKPLCTPKAPFRSPVPRRR